jgi:hypothetical protein
VSGTRARIAAVGLATAASLSLAAPALAHTQASLDNAHAGATNAMLSLNAEAESTTAGIAKLDVTLPGGIAPDQVSLASAPQGWTFARTAEGFTVSGAPLGVGTDAKASLRIATLPGAPTLLAFKTLVTYADGKVDRWIEVPTAAAPSPPNPAATVSLEPAGAGATATSAAAGNIVSPNAAKKHNPSPAAAAGTSRTATTLLWVIVGALLVLAALLTLLVWRRYTRLHTND